MATINIRNLDDPVYDRIKATATQQGVSINKLIKRVLSKVFLPDKDAEYHDLDAFFGTWTEEDHQAVTAASQDARAIDAELWR